MAHLSIKLKKLLKKIPVELRASRHLDNKQNVLNLYSDMVDIYCNMKQQNIPITAQYKKQLLHALVTIFPVLDHINFTNQNNTEKKQKIYETIENLDAEIWKSSNKYSYQQNIEYINCIQTIRLSKNPEPLELHLFKHLLDAYNLCARQFEKIGQMTRALVEYKTIASLLPNLPDKQNQYTFITQKIEQLEQRKYVQAPRFAGFFSHPETKKPELLQIEYTNTNSSDVKPCA